MSAKDTTFEALHTQDVILANANNISKWLGIMAIEGVKHGLLLANKDKHYAGRYKFHRWESEYECARSEIETLVKGEPEYQRHLNLISLSKEKLDMIEGTVKALTNLGFNIKNYIEWEKMKSGYA